MSTDVDADSCCTGIDLFPRRVHLRLPSGNDKFKTCVGGFLSIIFLAAVIIIFAIYSTIVVLETLDEAEGDEWKGFVPMFKLCVRLVADLGGVSIVLYILLKSIARCCTRNQLEDYLVTEIFAPIEKSKPSKKKDSKKADDEVKEEQEEKANEE